MIFKDKVHSLRALLLIIPPIKNKARSKTMPFIILLLLFPLPALSIDYRLPIPGISEISEINWNTGMISVMQSKNGIILDINFESLSNYSSKLMFVGFSKKWGEEFKATTQKRIVTGKGLIPSIELPLKLPKRVAGIIGEGGRLDVSGRQRVEFGGSESFDLSRVARPGLRQSWFPQLEMKQRLGVNLKGTVGEKIHVYIDHDSERMFDLKNTIRLEYEGDEDEIIKKINAGNTSLSLPGVKLIGGPAAHKGLFGIKTLAKVGPVDITAIASREQGERQSKHFTGPNRLTTDTLIIYDTDFIQNKFFFVGIYPPYEIRDLEVYVDDNNSRNDTETGAKPGIAIDTIKQGNAPDSTPGNFDLKIQGDFYYFDYHNNILELSYPLPQNAMLAVAFKYIKGQDTIQVGNTSGDTLILRMIKRVPKDTAYISWDYELRNIYSLGSAEIDETSFEMRIYKRNPGDQEDSDADPDSGKTYISMMGLEKDGKVNLNYIDFRRNLIIFPSLEPFKGWEPDPIYSTPNLTSEIGRNYYIWIRYQSAQTTFQLGAMNIIEGSVVVKIDGVTMQEGKDYIVNYDFGTLTLLTDEAKRPDASISIDFQYAPILQIGAKSLIGATAVYNPSPNTNLTSTLIFRSTSTMDVRPQLGREPRRILLGELNGFIKRQPTILTKLVDALPFVETNTPSSFSLTGVAGFSLPDPNTKDRVYIDDFEQTEVSHDIPIYFTRWSFGSIPKNLSIDDTASFVQLGWYNPAIGQGIKKYQLYPNLQSTDRYTELLPLTITIPANDTLSWGSIQTCISLSGMDFRESEYIELWVNGNKGNLYIDIGTDIPEDAPRRIGDGSIRGLNNRIDTEDANGNGQFDRGLGEDTGIDGVSGEDQSMVAGDDWNDDYSYAPKNPDYSKANGNRTEGNGLFDTEDIDGNGVLNSKSNYFEFRISLSNPDPKIVVDTTADGWRRFKIPIVQATTVGLPSWEYIKYVRIWVDGFTGPDTIKIASIEIVGSRWKNGGIRGEQVDPSASFEITQKNTEEDPDYYHPPKGPGFKVEYFYGVQGRTEKREQSLVLRFNNLGGGNTGVAYMILSTLQNWILYKTLELWVRLDNLTQQVGECKPQFFIHFGGDSLNYYEYKTELNDTIWRNIKISLDMLAHLKYASDTTNDSLSFKGSPSLTNIKYIELGIRNPNTGELSKISGEIWIDDIRLTDVRRNIGTASQISLATKFADLASINASINLTDPNFKRLGEDMQPKGGRSTGINLRGNISLDKFFPESWGLSLPVNINLTNNVSLPKYRRGSDVILRRDESWEQRAVLFQRKAFTSFKKTKKSKNKLLQATIDNLSGSLTWSEKFVTGYENIDSLSSYMGSISYGYSPKFKPINIFKGFKLRYFPSTISLSTNYQGTKSRSYVRADTGFVTRSYDFRKLLNTNGKLNWNPINSLKLNYSVNLKHNLAIPDSIRSDKGEGRSENIRIDFAPSIWKLTKQSISYNVSYNEDHRKELMQDSLDLRNVGTSSDLALNLTFDLQRFIKIFTKMGGKNKFLKKVESFFNRVSSPSFKYSISKRSQFYSLMDEPDFRYRYGLIDTVSRAIKLYSTNDQKSIRKNYSLGTGFSLNRMNLNVSFRENKQRGGRIGNEGETVSRTLPNLSLRIGSLEQMGILKKYLSSLSFATDFVITENRSKSGTSVTSSRELSLTPDIQAKLKKGVNLSFRGRITNKVGTRMGVMSVQTAQDYTFSASYSLRAPQGLKLPFLKNKIKLKSNLDLSLSMNYNKQRDQTKREEEQEWKPTRDTWNFSFAPKVGYKFSSDVIGGATLSWREWGNGTQGRRNRNVGLNFWVEFKF